ncbi:nucleotidyltransferase family protein [Catenovulum sediminis]|uniref:Nucleotidyltransferase family protein n=1 Tax=Catenovulum sediminis TaxID=1740262 RepID=A0ABV1RHJ8_9ALTE
MPVDTAILLAAGLGTRLKPLTNSVPKCLAPINGTPLLYYWIDNLVRMGVKRIFINTHYFVAQVVKAVQQHPERNIIELVYEDKLLGTAGTVRNILNKYAIDSPNVFIAHADNLCFCNWFNFLDYHANRKANIEVTMMAFQTDTPSSCGILEVDEENQLLAFHEKVENPPGNLANGAVYIFSDKALKAFRISKIELPDISLDIIPSLLGAIQVWENTVYLRDIGTPISYQQAQSDVLKYIDSKPLIDGQMSHKITP